MAAGKIIFSLPKNILFRGFSAKYVFKKKMKGDQLSAQKGIKIWVKGCIEGKGYNKDK